MRFIPIGSDEGGLDELVELSLSRASRSLTRDSNVRDLLLMDLDQGQDRRLEFRRGAVPEMIG